MKFLKLSLYLSLCIPVFFIESSYAVSGGKELEQSQANVNIITSIFTTELLLNLVFAIIVIIGTFGLSKLVTNRLTHYLESSYSGESTGREEMVGVLTRTSNITILSIGFVITLTILGIDIGIFMAGLGFGIGFTLKIFLTNFVSGILMVTQGFYHLGDVIEVRGRIGTIKQIHSLFTAIEQFDGVIFYVPNVTFLEEEILNYHSNDKRRVEVNVGVDYETDILKAKKVMIQVIDQFPNVLKAPMPEVQLTEMADSSINLSLRFWIASKDGYFSVRSNVTETVNMAFKQAGIKIPFPQITLSNRSEFNVPLNK